MSNSPLVSIIVPTYNRQKTLPDTIQSILQQTYTNWELIIVDDGSTDDTGKLVSQYSLTDKRIKYLSTGNNHGPSWARNYGMRNCRGEYIAFLDSDDVWLEKHLYESMKALQEEGVSVCFSLWYEKNNTTGELYKVLEPEDEETLKKVMTELNLKEHNNRIIFPSHEFYEIKCLKTVHICHINTMVLKREVVDRVGMLNEKLGGSEDTDYIYRIIHEYPFCLVKDYHFIYNQGEDNIHNFIDRRKLDIDALLSNSEVVGRFTFCGIYKIRMLEERKKFIRKSRKVKRKKECIERCNQKIEIKYFTMGFINKKTDKISAIYYLLKSFPYKVNARKMKLAVNILFPFFFKEQGIGFDDLWLN